MLVQAQWSNRQFFKERLAMRITRTFTFRYFFTLFCFVAFTPVVMSQEFIEPFSKAHLVSALKLNRTEKNPLEKMTVPKYIRAINRYGVAFPLTAATEREIRLAGAYFGTTDLDELITAVRENYRPDEPSEAEMKEALLRTVAAQGAQRIPEGIQMSNIIAGVRINFENFEKLGCTVPNYGPGYFCSYHVTMPMTFFANDGSAGTQNQLDAFNLLIRWLTNGMPITQRVTNKFVWRKDRWVVSVVE